MKRFRRAELQPEADGFNRNVPDETDPLYCWIAPASERTKSLTRFTSSVMVPETFCCTPVTQN